VDRIKSFGGTTGFLLAAAGALVYWIRADWKWAALSVAIAGLLLAAVAAWLNRADLANALSGRPLRHGANAIFYTLVVLAICGAVGFLAKRHNKRFDLTEQGLHTLAPQTISILKGADQDLTITAFYTTQAPERQKAEDLLSEYRYQNPRITTRVVDPVRSPGEARSNGIEFDGTIVVSTKNGEARVTPPEQATEENLTNAVLKATASTRNVVCFSTGHGERGAADSGADGLSQAADLIKKENFETRDIRLLEGETVLAGCTSLVIAGPKNALLPPEVDAVKAYLSAGGHVLALVEPHKPTGLEEVLAAWGLKLSHDFVVDVNPMARLMGGSPAAPVVYEYGSHAITKDLQGMASLFPTTASVQTATATEPGVTTTALASTTQQSWAETGPMTDTVRFDEGADRMGPIDIAAAASRKLDPPPGADPNAPEGETAAGGRETRLVLFGDSDFASNNYFGMGSNRDVMMNSIAWLNEKSDLISVRPKTQSPQPIILTGVQGSMLTLYTLAVPLLAAVAGFVVRVRRRRL